MSQKEANKLEELEHRIAELEKANKPPVFLPADLAAAQTCQCSAGIEKLNGELRAMKARMGKNKSD